MRSRRLALLLAGGLLVMDFVALAAGSDDGPPTWRIGDRWTYRERECYVWDCPPFSNFTQEVTGMETVSWNNSSVETYRVSYRTDGNESRPLFNGSTWWFRRSDLAYVRFLAADPSVGWSYDPPAAWLVFPLRVGAQWTVYYNATWGYGSLNTTSEVEVVNRTEVSVPAGTFLAYELVTLGSAATRSWYAPAVDNIVKEEPVMGPGLVSVLVSVERAPGPVDDLAVRLGLVSVTAAVAVVVTFLLLRFGKPREPAKPFDEGPRKEG